MLPRKGHQRLELTFRSTVHHLASVLKHNVVFFVDGDSEVGPVYLLLDQEGSVQPGLDVFDLHVIVRGGPGVPEVLGAGELHERPRFFGPGLFLAC